MSFGLKFFVCRHVSIWRFQNCVCLSVRLSVCLSVPREKNHHSFVNISPTLVIDTSMERSSRVVHHRNPIIWIFSKKFEIRILTFDEELKSPYFRQYQSYISNWYINRKVFTSTTAWEPKNFNIFSKKFEIRILTCDEMLKLP